MPLLHGKENVGHNIAEMIKAGHPRNQAIAAAYHAAEDAQVRGAGIAFMAPDNGLLFLRRAAGTDHAGEWCLPGGGAEDAESPEDTAVREAFEETGGIPHGPRVAIHRAVSDEGVDFTTFAQRVADKFEPKINDEHDAHQWALPHEAPQPLHPGVAKMLEKLRGGAEDAVFNEGDHPRDEDGKFGSGGAGSKKNKAQKKNEQQEISQRLNAQKIREEAFRIDNDYKRLMSANSSDKQKIAANISPEDAKLHLERLNAAPGEDPEARKLLASRVTAGMPEFGTHGKETAQHLLKIADKLADEGGGWVAFKNLHGGDEWAQEMIDLGFLKYEDSYVQLTPKGRSLIKNQAQDDKDDVAYELREMELGQAHDERFAFDRASVRRNDADGRLHVEVTNISKANVCPYLGAEIPDYEKLGLQRDKVYQLFRDPEELRRAAKTFNNLPLLSEHVPVSADDHKPELVIGSTGTDARFDEPYLRNSLVVWAQDAIDAIESGFKKELSSAYRYRADMTPGNYNGADYDGIMREIVGNHVALVMEGRAGSDVIVGDAALKQPISEEIIQMGVKLSRKATLAQGALMVFLKPKLAQDAKIDLPSILKDVTSKNYVESKPAIFGAISKALQGKLAKDAKLEDVHGFLDSLDKEEPAGDEEPEPEQPTVDEEPEDEKKGMDAEGVKNFLKDKISEDAMRALDAFMKGEEPTPVKAKDAEPEEEKVDKKAMDAAIAKAVKGATDAANQNQKAIREAENFVRPWVGNIAMAHDSADAVYRTALGALGKKVDADVPGAALRHILEAQPKPNDRKTADVPIAMDASALDSFNKMFPGAARIGHA